MTSTIAWRNLPYRRFARRLAGAVETEYGPRGIRDFNDLLLEMAGTYLYTAPQYDATHLSMMFKASRYNAKATQDDIKNTSAVNRTNWLAFCLPEDFYGFGTKCDLAHALAQVEGPDGRRYPHLREKLERYLGSYRPGNMDLLVDKPKKTPWNGVPKNPVRYGAKLRLQRAAAFLEELQERVDDATRE